MNRSRSRRERARASWAAGVAGPLPSPRGGLRDRAAWDVFRKLGGPKHASSNMTLMSCSSRQSRSHPLAAGAHHKNGLALLDRYHLNRRDEVGIVRDNNGSVERLLPRIVEEMYGEIHVRPLLFHRMDLSMAVENVRILAIENVRVGELPRGGSVATGAGQLAESRSALMTRPHGQRNRGLCGSLWDGLPWRAPHGGASGSCCPEC